MSVKKIEYGATHVATCDRCGMQMYIKDEVVKPEHRWTTLQLFSKPELERLLCKGCTDRLERFIDEEY